MGVTKKKRGTNKTVIGTQYLSLEKNTPKSCVVNQLSPNELDSFEEKKSSMVEHEGSHSN